MNGGVQDVVDGQLVGVKVSVIVGQELVVLAARVDGERILVRER